MTMRQSSSSNSTAGAWKSMPAQFTSTSSPPSRSTTVSTTRWALARSARSTLRPSASPPPATSSSAMASAFSDERPATATAAPASLISSEVTRPMPP